MKIKLVKEHKKAVERLIPALNEWNFYLAGGTALYYYFEHRYSIDLDFFTEKKFDLRDLKNFFLADEIKLLSKDTIYSIVSNINMSFFYYPYRLLKDLKKFDILKMASLEDILCMKMNAIISRGSRKDFIDLYFIMKNLKINSREAIKHFKEKFGEYNEMVLMKSLVFFKDAEKEPEFSLIKKASWDEVKIYLIKEFSKI